MMNDEVNETESRLCRSIMRCSSTRLSPPASGLRRAFTLLEIILALAILAAGIAILGEAVRAGYRNAADAQQITLAELHASSKMAEITSGIQSPAPVQGAPLEVDPAWLYSIELAPLELEGVAAVRVTVYANLPAAQQPASFSLVRWIPDPGFEIPEPVEEEPPAEDSSSASAGGDAR